MPKVKVTYRWVLALLVLICAAGVLIPLPARGGNAVAEEIISLDLTDQPLGEVLDEIAAATGYRFFFDQSWENFPVSASFENQPLHRGLKRILRNLNNAVIYGSDRTIKIVIYDQSATTETRSSASVVRMPSGGPDGQSRAFPQRPMTLPPPHQAREDSNGEDGNRQPDENEPPAAESEETAASEEEQNEIEAGESEQEVAESEAPEPNEDPSAETEPAGN